MYSRKRPIEDDNTYPDTRLIDATKAGDVRLVQRLLLIEKVDPNCVNRYGHTPLIEAALGGQDAIAALLLKHGANPNYINNCENRRVTALLWAARRNRPNIVRLLLDAKANIDHTDQVGETALNDAIFSGHVEVVKILLASGANVFIKNRCGETALEFIAKKETMFAACCTYAQQLQVMRRQQSSRFFGVPGDIVGTIEKYVNNTLTCDMRRQLYVRK